MARQQKSKLTKSGGKKPTAKSLYSRHGRHSLDKCSFMFWAQIETMARLRHLSIAQKVPIGNIILSAISPLVKRVRLNAADKEWIEQKMIARATGNS